MKTTLINGGKVVAFRDGEHRIIKGGQVVLAGNEIDYVGRDYQGEADEVIEAKGKLIMPGFINAHALATNSITYLRLDGSMDALSVSEDYALGREKGMDLKNEDLETSIRFAWAELLKGGATTSVAITPMAYSRFESPREQARILADTAGDMGARAYVSHQFRSAVKYSKSDGSTNYHWDKEKGQEGLREGVRFANQYRGSYEDRIRTMLFPYQFWTCDPELLKDTKRAGEENDLIIHIHAAEFMNCFHDSLRRYSRTPVKLLSDIGFLGEEVILTHVLYTSASELSGFPKTDNRDIELLADSGTTVARCPVLYGRSVLNGAALTPFHKYLDMGVNMVLGTDTFPMDMIREMQYAAILGKVAEKNPRVPSARDVFNAATVGGAKALGRDDLGKLAPEAKADLVIVDMNKLRLGLTDDPIKTLVYMGSQADIETVIVDGNVVVKDGNLLGEDEQELAKRANEINKRQKKALVENNPDFDVADKLFPPSFLEE